MSKRFYFPMDAASFRINPDDPMTYEYPWGTVEVMPNRYFRITTAHGSGIFGHRELQPSPPDHTGCATFLIGKFHFHNRIHNPVTDDADEAL